MDLSKTYLHFDDCKNTLHNKSVKATNMQILTFKIKILP